MLHFMIVLIPYINLSNLFWIIKYLVLRNIEPLMNGLASSFLEKMQHFAGAFVVCHPNTPTLMPVPNT